MPSISKAWVAEARTLAGISASVTITMLAQLAISAVEILIVARLGIHEFAGVALALSIDLLVFLAALGVVTAVTPLAAAARGRGDFERLRRYGQGGLLVGLAVSVPGVLVLLGCRSILVAVMGPGIEADSASAYLAGAAGGLPAWVLYVAARSLAVATGQVRVTTAVMLAVIPIHAALAPWLVFGGLFLPPLGALGASFAYHNGLCCPDGDCLTFGGRNEGAITCGTILSVGWRKWPGLSGWWKRAVVAIIAART